jgi:hypothetical protein
MRIRPNNRNVNQPLRTFYADYNVSGHSDMANGTPDILLKEAIEKLDYDLEIL